MIFRHTGKSEHLPHLRVQGLYFKTPDELVWTQSLSSLDHRVVDGAFSAQPAFVLLSRRLNLGQPLRAGHRHEERVLVPDGSGVVAPAAAAAYRDREASLLRPAVVVVVAIAVQKAGNHEGDGQGEAAETEQDETDQLTRVQVVVVGDRLAVDDLPVDPDHPDEYRSLRQEITDQNADDADDQEENTDQNES